MTEQFLGSAARPDPVDRHLLPSTEYVAASYLDRSGNNVVGANVVFDADLCASLFAAEDGTVPIEPERWLQCVDPSFITNTQAGDPDAWQSSDLLLNGDLQKRTYRIFRQNVVTG